MLKLMKTIFLTVSCLTVGLEASNGILAKVINGTKVEYKDQDNDQKVVGVTYYVATTNQILESSRGGNDIITGLNSGKKSITEVYVNAENHFLPPVWSSIVYAINGSDSINNGINVIAGPSGTFERRPETPHTYNHFNVINTIILYPALYGVSTDAVKWIPTIFIGVNEDNILSVYSYIQKGEGCVPPSGASECQHDMQVKAPSKVDVRAYGETKLYHIDLQIDVDGKASVDKVY
jgi:hypothetical protein